MAASASAPASPRAAPLPACATPDDSTFPLTTRIHGGPAAYAPGGGHGTWYLDLTNTTSRTCEGVHPVVVLVDAERALKPSQPRLEFYDGARRHPVALEATDEDELIGAFDGEDAGFAGFTVGPGRTLGVKVRLAFAADTVPNEVTVKAAVVQRRGGDGDWIGQSDDYRFRVEGGDSAAARTSEPMTPSVAATPDGTGAGFPFADELAGTGFGRIGTALAAVVLLLGAGSAAVLLGRRRR
ncbi:hypothetical protein GCM10010377_09840 [Streptomyces viridiviolaceus]|nr:hypothetical protein GCM10010377_09840 [Streptomyces viridiviolaceus]